MFLKTWGWFINIYSISNAFDILDSIYLLIWPRPLMPLQYIRVHIHKHTYKHLSTMSCNINCTFAGAMTCHCCCCCRCQFEPQLMKLAKTVLGGTLFDLLMKSSFYGHFVAGEDRHKIVPTLERFFFFSSLYWFLFTLPYVL